MTNSRTSLPPLLAAEYLKRQPGFKALKQRQSGSLFADLDRSPNREMPEVPERYREAHTYKAPYSAAVSKNNLVWHEAVSRVHVVVL